MPIKRFFKDAFSPSSWTTSHVDHEPISDLIGYHFRNPDLLQLALTHRSYVRSQNRDLPSNERLEFLGDSVLGLVIAKRLYLDFPDLSEGDLTKIKALLVNETTLAMIGREVGLNQHILLSPEEDRSGGRERGSIVSDAFESIIGAVFLDGGFLPAQDVVLRLIYIHRQKIMADKSQINYKGELLELIQSRSDSMPRYEVVSEEGPDHDKLFWVEVSVNGDQLGRGDGASKKEAEQKAAREALTTLQNKKH